MWQCPRAANGSVFASIALPDGGVIIGGSFTSMCAQSDYTGSAYRTPAAGGSVAGLSTDGIVYAAVSLSAGAVIIGGSFTRVKNTGRRFLARINADGSLHERDLSTAGGTAVNTLAIAGTDVIVGGEFSRPPTTLTTPNPNLPMSRVYHVTATAP